MKTYFALLQLHSWKTTLNVAWIVGHLGIAMWEEKSPHLSSLDVGGGGGGGGGGGPCAIILDLQPLFLLPPLPLPPISFFPPLVDLRSRRKNAQHHHPTYQYHIDYHQDWMSVIAHNTAQKDSVVYCVPSVLHCTLFLQSRSETLLPICGCRSSRAKHTHTHSCFLQYETLQMSPRVSDTSHAGIKRRCAVYLLTVLKLLITQVSESSCAGDTRHLFPQQCTLCMCSMSVLHTEHFCTTHTAFAACLQRKVGLQHLGNQHRHPHTSPTWGEWRRKVTAVTGSRGPGAWGTATANNNNNNNNERISRAFSMWNMLNCAEQVQIQK